MAVVRLTEATFDEVVGGAEVPVLVDVTAEWCPPCKAMEPVLDQLARDRSGQLVVASIDADEHPAVAARLGVMGLPTMVLFDGATEVARMVGARGPARLAEDLRPHLGAARAPTA
jgi:thioredoxin 1